MKITGAAWLGRVEAWTSELARLKREDRDCVAEKDIIKECLDRQDHDSKILQLIKKDVVPDPRHNDIKIQTGMNREAYREAGRWFLQTDCFQNWMTPGTGESAQRVVWLKGTGIVHVAHLSASLTQS